ncbi:hypothetical protein OIO90_006407 [Microbotryomycetes sp. JL221]|nr:hypothetical protein OIO90_006407 [Microbotryomycetes sp. JL221]
MSTSITPAAPSAASAAIGLSPTTPSAEEVQRKLGSPNVILTPIANSQITTTNTTPADSLEQQQSPLAPPSPQPQPQPQRRGSTNSRRLHGSFSSVGGASMMTNSTSGMSSASDEDTPSSPNRPTVPLSAISEQESAGSDSDASSTTRRYYFGQTPQQQQQQNQQQQQQQQQQWAAHSAQDPNLIDKAFERLRVGGSGTTQQGSRLSDNVAVKSGYLMKKGEKRKTWKKRWFVLRGGQLAMYKNDKEYRLLRLIPLPEIHSVGPVEIKKHSYTFGIVTPKRTYYIKAESNESVTNWCRSIEQAKQEFLTTMTTRSSNDTPTRRPSFDNNNNNNNNNNIGQNLVQTASLRVAPPTPGIVSPNGTVTSAAIPIPTTQTSTITSSNPVHATTNNINIPGARRGFSTSLTPSTPPTSYSQTSQSILSSSFTSTTSSFVDGQTTSLSGNDEIGRGDDDNDDVVVEGALGLRDSQGQQLNNEMFEFDKQRRMSNQSYNNNNNIHNNNVSGMNRELSLGHDVTTSLEPRSTQLTLSLPPVELFNNNNNVPSSPGGGFKMKNQRQGSLQIPSSPGGGISSSEDEEGFDRYVSPIIGTSNSAGGGGELRFVETNLNQQQPQQPQQYNTSTQPNFQTPITSVDVGFGDPNKVILSGYLMKQGKRKNWRKRWFVLLSGKLMYSKSHMDTKIHRQIPITRILDAIEYEPTRGKQKSMGGGGGALSPLINNDSNLSGLNGVGSTPLTSPGGGIATTTTTTPSDQMPHIESMNSHHNNHQNKNYENCFKIITPKRTYLVCAPTEEDEIKWLAALQCLVARKSGKLGPTTPVGGVYGSLTTTTTMNGTNDDRSQVVSHGVEPDKMLGASGLTTTTTTTMTTTQPLNGSGSSMANESMMTTTSGGPPPSSSLSGVRRPSTHGRQRSVTDAARSAIREAVERRKGGGGVTS